MNELTKAKNALKAIKTKVPPRYKQRIDEVLKGGLEGYLSLTLGPLIYLGIMVADNLSDVDRDWWGRRGTLQVTTCVSGLATVFFDADADGKRAMDTFTPLSRAWWDLGTNALVPTRPAGNENKCVYIGTIMSTGVREVNILTDISVYAIDHET